MAIITGPIKSPINLKNNKTFIITPGTRCERLR